MCAAGPSLTSGEPYVPEDAGTVLLELPARSGPGWEHIETLRQALDASPRDAALAAEIAETYLELFRTEGDPRLIGFAAAVIRPWQDDSDSPAAVARQLIAVDQLGHRFDEALDRNDRLLERYPGDPQALLVEASIALTIGETGRSRDACSRLVLSGGALLSSICVAAVDARTGEPRRALAALEMAAGRYEAGEDALAEWANLVAAETAAAIGETGAADRYFERAIEASGHRFGARSIYLLAAYADFLLANDEPGAVVALLETAPPADAVLLRLARAKRALGRTIEPELSNLRSSLALTLARREPTHAREAAYFSLHLLERPELALPLALANWATQKEPLDAELVLESAAAACAAKAASATLEWIDVNALEHVRLDRLRERLAARC